MNSTLLRFCVLLAAAAPVVPAVHAATAPAEAAKRHALKGVVTNVLTDQSALMVKHEDIPGVMRAMTMMFKVDAETLKTVKKGDAVTGMMARENGEWRLYDVKVVPAKKS